MLNCSVHKYNPSVLICSIPYCYKALSVNRYKFPHDSLSTFPDYEKVSLAEACGKKVILISHFMII
jgi:hypothetical protein